MEANTASGSVSNAFEDLRVSGQWGAKRITGRLGAGSGSLKATTVSGSIALLRRPPRTSRDGPEDTRHPGDPGQDGRTARQTPRRRPTHDTGPRPGRRSTDKKVL